MENEYLGTSYAVGEMRAISGFQAVGDKYNISEESNSKWGNLLVLFLMAFTYRVILFVLLYFRVKKNTFLHKLFLFHHDTNNPR